MAKRKPRAPKTAPSRSGRAGARRPAGKATARRTSPARRRTATRQKEGARPKGAARSTARAGSKAKRATKRAPARAASARRPRPGPPALDRVRRRLPEDDVVPTPPSTLDFERKGSAASSGRAELAEHRRAHHESGPALTGGDVDAQWEAAYASGDEAPGGDNPTPDQDVVEEIGRALGVEYEDHEELKGADKVQQRDRHRWELDPASAEDYRDRIKEKK